MTNPKLITTAFAENGTANDIPESSATEPQLATMSSGFPDITQKPIAEGGIPPERADFNGILKLYGQHIVHLNKGLGYEFDADFATAIGGYPLHARIVLTNGNEVKNTIPTNTTNPNTDMTGWELTGGARTDAQLITWSGRTQEEVNKDEINLLDYFKGALSATGALQKAIDENPSGVININKGVYNLSSVSIQHDISFNCPKGVVFKRLNNIDIRQSAWNDGTAMFESKSQGLSILFFGSPTFDGNNQNQLDRFKEPTGFSVKIQPPQSPVKSNQPTTLYMENPKFINGTLGYLCVRGDDVNRRYLTRVILENPDFSDTLMGTGKGDPQAITALGYQPNYAVFYDYVSVNANNVSAEFTKQCTTGEYAPVALLGTFFGSDYNNSGEVSFFLTGTTTVKNLGRSGKLYNDDSNYLVNNGIGAIDIYGKGETMYVENFIGVDQQNVSVRAKASIKNYIVKSAILTNCHRGLQVSVSTTGPSRTIANVGSLTSYGGTIPQLEFTGSSPADMIKSATIQSLDFIGAFTNPENLPAGNGNIYVRNVDRFLSNGSKNEQSPLSALRLLDVNKVDIYAANLTSNDAAILCTGVGELNLFPQELNSNNGAGVNIQASSRLSNINIFGGKVSNSKDNAVLNVTNNANITINGLLLDVVTGLNRGFVSTAGSTMKLVSCSASASIATPVLKNGASIFEFGNSWNPNVQYGSLYTTTIGKNKRGDVVYNSAPAPNQPVGWVCTTGDGSNAGIWSSLGNISS